MPEPVDGGIPLPPGDFLLYHWSPARNRDGITARGLRIRQKPVEARGAIRYPYVAFGFDAVAAWEMSGEPFGVVAWETWDLWAVRASAARGFEVIPTDDGEAREARVYHSIPARCVQYVASRTIDLGT